MALANRHPEEVKAALRIRFGSVFAFEDAMALPRKSVSDTLRGRPNARVVKAIEDALATNPSENSDPTSAQSDNSDTTRVDPAAHRLNTGVR